MFSYCTLGFTSVDRLKTSSTYDGDKFNTFLHSLVFQIFKNKIGLNTFHVCRSKINMKHWRWHNQCCRGMMGDVTRGICYYCSFFKNLFVETLYEFPITLRETAHILCSKDTNTTELDQISFSHSSSLLDHYETWQVHLLS